MTSSPQDEGPRRRRPESRDNPRSSDRGRDVPDRFRGTARPPFTDSRRDRDARDRGSGFGGARRGDGERGYRGEGRPRGGGERGYRQDGVRRGDGERGYRGEGRPRGGEWRDRREDRTGDRREDRTGDRRENRGERGTGRADYRADREGGFRGGRRGDSRGWSGDQRAGRPYEDRPRRTGDRPERTYERDGERAYRQDRPYRGDRPTTGQGRRAREQGRPYRNQGGSTREQGRPGREQGRPAREQARPFRDQDRRWEPGRPTRAPREQEPRRQGPRDQESRRQGPRDQESGRLGRDRRDERQYRQPRYRDEEGGRARGRRPDEGFRGGERRRYGDESREVAPREAARRPSAPELPEDIKATDLDSDIRAELLSLARPIAETVARHLVATGRLIDEDPAAALEHAMAARRLAPRIAAVREAVGLAAYHSAEWQTAIAELRTYHRLSGRQAHLAMLADCERALGRPERAIDLYRGADRTRLDQAEAIELLIVAAGARTDLGQHDAAVAMLQVRELGATGPQLMVVRLRYAYADALLAAGRREEAREWFSRAAAADTDATTDAAQRLLELDGVLLSGDETDEAGEEDEEDDLGEDGAAGTADDGGTRPDQTA